LRKELFVVTRTLISSSLLRGHQKDGRSKTDETIEFQSHL
jgi:hypothetical protein